MTAVTLAAPALSTSTAPASGKAATDAGAGFADALLALLAVDTQAGPGQQQPGTDGEAAAPGDEQPSVLTEAPAALPQFTLPAVAAPQAQTAAAAPAAAVPAPVLPAPRPDVLTAAQQPAPAAIAQDQPVAAVLSGVVPTAPTAQASDPAQPAAAKDEQDHAGGHASTPATPAQYAPVQHGTPAAPAAPGQGIPFTALGPGAAATPAVPAAPLVATPALAAPAAPSPGTHPAASPDTPVAPAADGATAFEQAAATAAPSRPAQVPSAAPATTDLPVPRGYTAQLARPLFTIAAAGPGQHTITVEVNPQNLGPVTVQAHSGADGIRIEMFAATSDGRDALRQALPELKKDLAGAGINASLDLSSSGQGTPQGGQDRESFTRRVQTSNQTPAGGRLLEVKAQNTPTRPGLYGPETTLDVLA
ncbi:flagellar hook-length control protein FliK [Pseudarthrobacter sp. BIM B-2242]|uniref:flagellar hook-length control protein FliK n=1 Tax=Pseudarthrobacter sp. BIM B-2242 TaxID=2772401 RepID=UPI00168BDBCB|nr:flagellar hook-length control protein FliK [Pseudarthrobacter sp. BIM B-2242]QOD05757.1 flagellar hook-length control protein FliK [Pseudarthrobacter sp. BIM B-2242]